ncbi:MAG: hypothetical protein QOJ62_2770 [Actinomycetota bacterium]|nr:hypothetical protein [Actinomycetota bacterium]
MLSALLTGKLAALAIGTTVGIGGATTAAYANVLPASIQTFAHATIGAPEPHPQTQDAAVHQEASASADPVASPTATQSHATKKQEPKPEPKKSEPAKTKPPVAAAAKASGPDARAAYGLCRAYTEATQHGLHLVGSLQEKLVKLAGGIDKITAYCAAVPKPTPNPSEKPKSEAPNPKLAIELCAAFARTGTLPTQYLPKLAALAGGTDRIAAFCATVPKPSSPPHPTPTPVLPHLSDTQWAIGLCNAYGHGVHLTGEYLAKLTALAGGGDNIASFCATVPKPTPNPSEHASPAPTTPATIA